MAVEKLTYPAKQNAVQEKINEIIDEKQDNVDVFTPQEVQTLWSSIE